MRNRTPSAARTAGRNRELSPKAACALLSTLLFVLVSQTNCFHRSNSDSTTPGTPSANPASSSNPSGANSGSAAFSGSPAPATPGQPVTSAASSSSAGTVAPGTSAPAVPPALPAPEPPRVYTLPAGAAISVYTSRDLSTKTSKPGDRFTASLARPLVAGGLVIAKQGAPVEGEVTDSNPGGRVKGVAHITIALRRLTLIDGHSVELSTTSFTKQARTTHTKDAEKIIGGAGIGAVIGALAGGRKGAAIGAGVGGGAGTGLVLATRGDPAVIPGESHLAFRTRSPIRMTRIP
ncbi:MAG TPA: hypothetical protein VJX67_12105 [Blastocatellia bacterium]|nr:hypothetical protein [Blastocatellia bacterium]